jgi:hypothetical protein
MVIRLRAHVDDLKKYAPSKKPATNLVGLLSKYMEGPALEIFRAQVENYDRPPQGRRFTDSIKLFALALV